MNGENVTGYMYYREAKPEAILLVRRELLQRLERPLESFRVVGEIDLDFDAGIARTSLEGCAQITEEITTHDLIIYRLEKADIWAKRNA